MAAGLGKPIVLGVASLAAAGVAYGPLVVRFVENTWQKTHYQHFPFVVLASVVLFAQRLADSPPAERRLGRWWCWGLYLAAWLLLALAYQIGSPFFGVASLILLLGGWGVALADRLDRPFPLGPWLLLWLVLPPPIGLDNRLMESLQRWSSSLSSQALDLLGVNHLMDGNTLVLPDKQLFVDEACSGIVSVISITACAAMYGVWRRRQALHTLLLMIAAAGWATLLNVVRITVIALAEVWHGVDLAEGPAHTGIGLAIFGLSLVTLICTDWLLRALLAEVGPRWEALTGEPVHFGRMAVAAWDWVVGATGDEPDDAPHGRPIRWSSFLARGAGLSLGIVPTVAFAALGLTQVVRPALPERIEYSFPERDVLAARLQDGAMPDEVEGLTLQRIEHQVREENNVFGEHSVIYHYTDEESDSKYLVSCDFPFARGWHELSVCYRGIGWRLDDRIVYQPEPSAVAEPHDVARLELTKPDGWSALVTFCACYENGDPVTASTYDFVSNILRAFSRRNVVDASRRSFQAQVLVQRPSVMTDRERRLSAELLGVARERFIAASTATTSKTDAPATATPDGA